MIARQTRYSIPSNESSQVRTSGWIHAHSSPGPCAALIREARDFLDVGANEVFNADDGHLAAKVRDLDHLTSSVCPVLRDQDEGTESSLEVLPAPVGYQVLAWAHRDMDRSVSHQEVAEPISLLVSSRVALVADVLVRESQR